MTASQRPFAARGQVTASIDAPSSMMSTLALFQLLALRDVFAISLACSSTSFSPRPMPAMLRQRAQRSARARECTRVDDSQGCDGPKECSVWPPILYPAMPVEAVTATAPSYSLGGHFSRNDLIICLSRIDLPVPE
jgi:hypothetical protein